MGQWGRFGGILGGHGPFEWLSWEDFGAIWEVLGGSWATCGALLGGLGDILDPRGSRTPILMEFDPNLDPT